MGRKEFLTGFRKRKDERRKQWKEKIDRQLKNEIKKIKNDTKSKLEKGGMSKKNSSHHIVPEVAHLINSDAAQTMVKDIGGASVSITTLDSLKKAATPWHDIVNPDDSSEDDEEDEDEEEEGGRGGAFQSRRQGEEGYKQDGCESVAQVEGVQGKRSFESKEAAKCCQMEEGKEGGEKEAACKKVCKTKRLNRILLQKYIYFFQSE